MRFPWQKERALSPLEQLVAAVCQQQEVYDHDYAVAEADPNRERDMHELALDGLAHHVFNSLRGANDVIEIFDDAGDASTVVATHAFEDVRKILAEAFRA